jgi:LCP family protein required for cell wall assembly
MIENELREAFLRAEDMVPDANRLVPGINAAARRRRSRRRMVRSTAAALAVLIAVAVPVWGRGLLARHEVAPGPAATQVPEATGALNFLIAGLDGRAGGQDPQFSDALVIAHVPADRSAVYLVSVPRDLQVNIPGRGLNRANAAYAWGGIPLLNQTMTALTGLTFDGNVVVDFAGLVAVVDGLGGVELCVDQPTKSYHTGTVYPPGCRRFSGAEAKDYLRQRYGLPGAAKDRDRHVAQFLAALVRQITSAGTFTDFAKLRALAAVVGSSVTVNAHDHSVVDLAWQLRGSLNRVIAVATPTEDNRDTYMPELAASATGLFGALRTDTMAGWGAANPSAVQTLG